MIGTEDCRCTYSSSLYQATFSTALRLVYQSGEVIRERLAVNRSMRTADIDLGGGMLQM